MVDGVDGTATRPCRRRPRAHWTIRSAVNYNRITVAEAAVEHANFRISVGSDGGGCGCGGGGGGDGGGGCCCSRNRSDGPRLPCPAAVVLGAAFGRSNARASAVAGIVVVHVAFLAEPFEGFR